MQNKIHVLCKKTFKKIYNAGGGGGENLGCSFYTCYNKIVCLSKTKSIKISENIRKPHFDSLSNQTACFKKLLNSKNYGRM